MCSAVSSDTSVIWPVPMTLGACGVLPVAHVALPCCVPRPLECVDLAGGVLVRLPSSNGGYARVWSGSRVMGSHKSKASLCHHFSPSVPSDACISADDAAVDVDAGGSRAGRRRSRRRPRPRRLGCIAADASTMLSSSAVVSAPACTPGSASACPAPPLAVDAPRSVWHIPQIRCLE